MLQVQEVLTRLMQDGSNATLLHDVLVREEPDAHGASLGIVSIEVDGADPGREIVLGLCPMTWWCMAPVLVCPRAPPGRYNFSP
jgi:hypothetical protein